jgi:hypothetical protein
MLTPFNLQLKRNAKTTPQQNKTTSEKKKHKKTKQRNPKKFIKKINLAKKKEKKAYNAIVRTP